MRKFILIAGFALVSVAAHAGDRGLSLGDGEATKVSAPARADGQRTAEAPQAAEAPKYVERPAVVEPKTETTRSETIRSENGSASAGNAARMRQRQAAMQQGYAGRPQGAGAGGASARRAAMMQRQAGAQRARYGIKARIISALHRHGIYF